MSFLFAVIVGGYWLIRLLSESIQTKSFDIQSRLQGEFISEFYTYDGLSFHLCTASKETVSHINDIMDSIDCLRGMRLSQAPEHTNNKDLAEMLLYGERGFLTRYNTEICVPYGIRLTSGELILLSDDDRMDIARWLKAQLERYGAHIDLSFYTPYSRYGNEKSRIIFNVNPKYPIKRIDPHDNQHP